MIQGTDISFWEFDKKQMQDVDFQKMVKAGSVFCIMRGTWGLSTDTAYTHFSNRSLGVVPVRGIYNYFLWYEDHIKQMGLLIELWRQGNIELPPIIDLEDYKSYPTKKIATQRLVDSINYVYDAIGEYPIIYTSPGWWKKYGSLEPVFMRCPLWVAHWYTKNPIIPPPFYDWTFHQFTQIAKASDYGMHSKGIDVNFFKGSMDDLALLCGGRVKITKDMSLEERITRLERLFF